MSTIQDSISPELGSDMWRSVAQECGSLAESGRGKKWIKELSGVQYLQI